MSAYFEEPDKTSAKQEERKNFIRMPYSLEDSVSSKIMTKAVVMLLEKLFG